MSRNPGIVLCESGHTLMQETDDWKFPDDFLWGSATSAHQVEGNNVLNNWYVWEQKDRIDGQQKSGMACDHYNRFREDIDLLVSLNQNAYRFSIEWSRIEPKRGKIDRKEIAHYEEVLTYLREKKVKSFVTLHHFTSPIWFDWERSSSVNHFKSFAELIAKELGHLIDFWCTINEPHILAQEGYLEGAFPPGKKSMKSFFRVLDNMIAGHNAAYHAIHNTLPNALVGAAQNSEYFLPASDDPLDRFVTEINREVRNRYFLDRTVCDYIGLQYYAVSQLRFDPSAPKRFYSSRVSIGLPKSDLGWSICPDGLYHVLVELEKYKKPVYVTENGIADSKDKQRKDYLEGHLKAVYQAIAYGIDVRGYLHWSLMDNFEWCRGFASRFGLCEVDYATQKRTVRASAKYYAEICKKNSLSV